MHTLVLGRMGVERTQLEELVRDAGHAVGACHDDSWGCVGMDGACPLDTTEGVDVAVAVADPSGRFDVQGIACVHRARIPIVAVGATATDPVLDYVVTNLPHGDPSVLTAMEAAAGHAVGHRVAIEDALRDRLEPGEAVTVTVERRSQCIDVMLVSEADGRRAAAFADAARGAVRQFDPYVDVIDVSIVPPD